MKRRRDLLLTNLLSLFVLLAALLAGWWEAALFGLAVLVVMDLLAVLREQFPRLRLGSGENTDAPPEQEEGPPALVDTDSERTDPDVRK
jgi:uncharacterized protein (DUF58 family)